VLALGLTLLFFIMLFAARWLFYEPVHRLVGQLTGALARDVERRRRAEEKATSARFEAEEHLTFRNNLLDASEAVGIIATDGNGVVRIFNRAAEHILGYREVDLVGKLTLAELHRQARRVPDEELPLRSFMQVKEGEAFRVDKAGREHLLSINESEILDSTGQHSGRLVTFIDISEQKRLEAELQLNELQLIQNAKMATLGEMATGVAHELNQPLNNIGLLTSRVRRRMRKLANGEDAEFVNEKLELVQGQVQRASRIIEQLRSFGRRSGAEDFQPVRLAAPVRHVVDMLKEQFNHHAITLEIEVADDLPSVRADQGQLEQVFVNLIVNARDALRDGKDGWQAPDEKRIHIKGRTSELEGRPAVAISICDNGPGISPELKEKVFQPFFTTKEIGQGTGLGLSISYSLIQGFGGTLSVESEIDQGATFTITLLQVTSADGAKKQDSASR
jgi:histidine kinase